MTGSTRIAGVIAAAGIAVLGITGCTPEQVQAWRNSQVQQTSASEKAIASANSVLGYAYTWGGSSPSTGFDCSGLVRWAFGTAGVNLPGGSYNQIHYGTPVSSPQRGDLVFYGPGGSQHVAIYLGNGQVIQSSNPSTGVNIAPMYWGGNPSAFRRL